MNLFRTGKCILLLAVLTIGFASCKKEAKTNWDTEILTPLASSSLSIQNIVKDSSVITNPDNTLTLAYSSNLYTFNIADHLVNIPDTAIGQKFTLTDLTLPNQSFNFKASLGFLANAMVTSPDPGNQFLGQFILSQNGNTIAVPAVNGLSMPVSAFDATQFFDSAYLTSGEVQLWAINQLPIDVSGAQCIVRNIGDNSIVGTANIPYIAAGDSQYIEIPIAGARITNQLGFEMAGLSSPGSNGVPVPIDTNDYIQLRVFVAFLKASEAWAKFPTQNVVDVTEEVVQEIGERKFSYIDARSGFLHIYITSSVEEQLYLEYTLVGAFDNYGNPLKKYTTVPAASNNSTVTVDELVDISGYSINLTGKDGSKFNTYTQRVVARMDSSGVTRHITNSDSLNIRYEIVDVAPNYIKGYVGRDTISTIDSSDFSFLDMIKSGTLNLEDVSMNFTVENGIGVDGQVIINGLTAVSRNNGTRALTGSIIGQPLVIGRASDFPLTKSINRFPVNSSNSNIKDIINSLPNKLVYDVDVKTNLAGNTQQYRDFAYLESGMNITLDAEIPLSLMADHLLLEDTFDFNISSGNTNIDGITDGIINLIAQNKYPIEANVTLVLYDETWTAVDTLIGHRNIQAADLDNNCRTTEKKRSKIPLYVSEERMNNIKLARHAVVRADFSTVSNNTFCNGQHLKIYSDYTLDITLTARFNYKPGVKF